MLKRIVLSLALLALSTAAFADNEILREYVLTSKNTLLELPIGSEVLGVDMDNHVRLFVREPVATETTENRRFRALPADISYNPAGGPYTYIGSIWVRKSYYGDPGEHGCEWLHWAEDETP